MKRKHLFGAIVAAFLSLGATKTCDKPPARVWTIADVPEAAVLVRPESLQADARFSFRAVLGQLLITSQLDSGPAAQDALLKTMLDTLGATELTNPDSRLRMAMKVRGSESKLAAGPLADELVPIGLFNRIDAMTGDASDCGEYRIAFSSPNRFFLLIFEARMPNDGNAANCGKLARFWQRVGTMAPADQLKALSDFYFVGVEGFPPAIHAKHFGTELGQLRSNTFIDSPWMLREWKLTPEPGRIMFDPHPAMSPTPLPSLYSDSDAGSLNPALHGAMRTAFQNEFVGRNAAELASLNVKVPLPDATTEQIIVGAMGTRVDRQFAAFESAASSPVTPPDVKATLRSRLSNQSEGNVTVNVDQLVSRAGVISCGGCHGFSPGQSVGNVAGANFIWPGVNTFRHITPSKVNGQNAISPALAQFIIPYRRANMVTFLNMTERMRATTARARRSDDKASRLFDAIVRTDNIQTSENLRAEYDAAVAERTRKDIRSEGFFVRSRRTH